MSSKSIGWFAAILSIAAVFPGCKKWNVNEAPAGFAVVREHVISAPRNDPPISANVVFKNDLPVNAVLDYTITEIDGAPVIREAIPPWVDLQRGALVSAGAHKFKALVSPYVRPSGYQPREVVFAATVESSKVYFLVSKDCLPVLIEDHPKSQ